MTFGGFHKKKRRSKQKNFKKDTRPENLRPGGKDYVDPTTRPDYKAPAVAKHKVIGASNLEANLKAKAAKEARILAEKQNGAKAAAPVEDKPMLNCRDCTEAFDFTAKEQEVYESKGWAVPSRCRACREKKRADPTSNAFKGGAKEAGAAPKIMGKTKANSAPTAEPPTKRKKLDSSDKNQVNNIENEGESSDDSASDASSDSGPETLNLKTEKSTLPIAAKETKNVESKSANDDKSDSSKSSSSEDDDDDDDESNPEALVAKAFSRKTNQFEEDDDEMPKTKENDNAYENCEEDEEWVEEEEGGDNGAWGDGTSEDYPWVDYRDAEACAKPLEAFDLIEALELPKEALTDDGKIRGGGNRLRAQYHRLSMRYHPDHFEPKRQGNATPVATQRLAATLYFRRVAVAFVSLLDPDRALIYAKHGWAGLKASEAFAETSSLDTPPFARFDAFFEGTDPDDRQYLLLEASSGGHFSDEERPDKRGEVTEPEDNDSDEDSDEDSQDEEAYLALVARDAKDKAQPTKSSSSLSSKKRMEVPFPHPPAGVGAPLAMAAAMPTPSQQLAMTAAAGDPFARVAAAHKASASKGPGDAKTKSKAK